jgi:putative ABC transport system ATP-binding protein
MGLSERLSHHPRQLSGGEMQRAAIARAVIHAPLLVIADEPTGSLDSENGARVLDLLLDVNRQLGVTVLLATHDVALAASADAIVHLRDGRVQRVEDRASLVPGAAL